MKLGKYEKGVIITGVAVLIIFLILLTADGIKNIGKNNNQIGLSEQEIVVPPNAPVLSAGMIPVKYEGDNLKICKNDSSWYSYENGTPAYMMLNDGVYQSELTVDMTNKKLASDSLGQVVPKEEQGTIYMWIPRFTKNVKTKEIKYIEPEVNLGGEWEISDTFVHKQVYDETKPDYSLSGIWIEKEPLANTAEVSTKVANMTGEENKYGFIANTVATNAGIGDCHVAAEPWLTGTVPSGIANPENINRTIIKVINDKHYEPIKAKIEYNETAGIIEIAVTYNKNGIQKIEDKNGNSVSYTNENGIIKSTVPVKAGKNHFTIIDNKNNKKELEVTVALPIYAKLYTDGTLALTSSDKTLSGKTVDIEYGDISNKSRQPWFSESARITIVDIIDEIAPLSTTYWFSQCTNLTNINNIEKLDTSNVKSMRNMFYGCSSLTELDLNSFDTSNVTNMYAMFYNCNNLTSLNVSSFNTSNVTSMWGMFYACSKLTKLDVSNFDTSSVSGPNMIHMFIGCSSLTELDLSNFNTSKVTNMNSMFNGCSSLTKLNVSSFDTSNVTDMAGMFSSCSSLTELDLSNFNTTNVIHMSYMFGQCNSLAELDLSNFNTTNVTNMAQMFYYCDGLENLDVSSFDTSNVTNMSYMFHYCRNLTSIDVSRFNTSNVINMSHMFEGCNKLTILDVSSFDTSNVTNMNYMFDSCATLTNLNLRNFNTVNVTDMNSMFSSCRGLTTLNLSNFNTSNVTDMCYMFNSCSSLTSVDISRFNTEKVTNMRGMFNNCSKLTTLNLRSFNTNKVTNMQDMFRICTNLTKIYVGSNWKETSNSGGMFSGCGTNSVIK